MSNQYITSIGLNYKKVGRLWRGVWLWRISGGYLEGVWLWRISGSYSQEMSMLRIGVPKSQFSCRLILMIMKCKYIHL